MLCFGFLLFYLFYRIESRQTNCLKIYQTDLCQNFRFGRTMVVDDQSEISFSIHQGTLTWQQPIFVVVFLTELIRWT